jgi:hypothetical protein
MVIVKSKASVRCFRKLIYLTIAVAIFSMCCGFFRQQDDVLSIPRVPYNGTELRIDGYYYVVGKDGWYYAPLFFYRNGILHDVKRGYSPDSMEDSVAAYLKSDTYFTIARNNKTTWGVFTIKGDKIQLEKWYPTSGGARWAYVRSGTIIDDTTFRTEKSMRSDGSDSEEENFYYHFKQFSPKPDSTNSFIP